MTGWDATSPGERIAIPDQEGPLAALVHLPERLPAPTVVCCHGLLSSKDSEKFAAICGDLARAGYAAVRFDFSGCGESPPDLGSPLLAARRRNLAAALAYVRHQPWADGSLGLLGSSLGGYLALLAAASQPEIPVKALVCWATPWDLSRIRLALESGRWLATPAGDCCRLGEPEDLSALPPLSGVLIIHGQMDATVPWQEAVQIYRQAADPKQLLLFETADHRFLDPACRQLAIQASIAWFARHLSGTQ